MNLQIIAIYLWASLFFYLISGGADFGAGIIELFSAKKNKSAIREMMHNATAPIWEANHMWLILAIVILFVGFPDTYATLSSQFYLPLTAMLMGIIGRGTSYAFRNSDTKSRTLSGVDNFVYVASSLVTPFFIGLIASGFFAGKVSTDDGGFEAMYIFNWLGYFELAVGLFTVSLCSYLASIYIIGNDKLGDERFYLSPYAAKANMLCIFFAILIFVFSYQGGLDLYHEMFQGMFGKSILICCAALTVIVWIKIKLRRTGRLRVLAALQVFFIQLALFWERYPQVIVPRKILSFNISIPQAPDSTLNALAWALIIGSMLIIPALAYLIYSFEGDKESSKQKEIQNLKIDNKGSQK